MLLLNKDYATYYLGKNKTNKLLEYIEIISSRCKVRQSDLYKKVINEFLSFYEFEWDENLEEDTITVDLLLDKNLILENINITEDMLIAFARAGFLPIQKQNKAS